MCTALEKLKESGRAEGKREMIAFLIARADIRVIKEVNGLSEEGGRKIFCVYGEKSSLIRTRYV